MNCDDRDCCKGAASMVFSFLLGGLVGAATALIFAPKSGRQTREQLWDMAQEASEKASEYCGQARTKISSTVQKGTDVFQNRKSETQIVEQEVGDIPQEPKDEAE